MVDSNEVVRAFLVAQPEIQAVVDQRVFCPRIPEDSELPAIGLHTAAGHGLEKLPEVFSASVQIDCWASTLMEAREVYRTVYDVMQWRWGLTSGASTLLSIYEETHGQDMPEEPLHYWRVLSQWRITIQ